MGPWQCDRENEGEEGEATSEEGNRREVMDMGRWV